MLIPRCDTRWRSYCWDHQLLSDRSMNVPSGLPKLLEFHAKIWFLAAVFGLFVTPLLVVSLHVDTGMNSRRQ